MVEQTERSHTIYSFLKYENFDSKFTMVHRNIALQGVWVSSGHTDTPTFLVTKGWLVSHMKFFNQPLMLVWTDSLLPVVLYFLSQQLNPKLRSVPERPTFTNSTFYHSEVTVKSPVFFCNNQNVH